MSKENVILVDEKDNQVGLMPKLEAHQKGLLHRAFSVFILGDPEVAAPPERYPFILMHPGV